jgi:hypothetical protein
MAPLRCSALLDSGAQVIQGTDAFGNSVFDGGSSAYSGVLVLSLNNQSYSAVGAINTNSGNYQIQFAPSYAGMYICLITLAQATGNIQRQYSITVLSPTCSAVQSSTTP